MSKKIIIIGAIVIVVAVVAAILLFSNPAAKKQVISCYVPGDYFVTNIKGSTRLLKATIVIELNTDKADEYLTENNHIIRDVIVFALREQTEDELRSTGIQDELGAEIVSKLGDTLDVDYIQTIYFSDFVIQ
jgi:flagellar basal body-associated protein FliL